MKTMSPPAGVQTRSDRDAGPLDAILDFAFGAELGHAQCFVNDFGRDHQLVGLALGHAAAPASA